MAEHPDNMNNPQSHTPASDALTEAQSARQAAEAAYEVSWKVSEQLLIVGLREHELAGQLRRQLAFYRALVDSLGEGVYGVNLAGRITFVNPAAEQMLGQTEAELLGRDAYATLHVQPSDTLPRLALPSPLLTVMRNGTSYRAEEALFRHGSGGVFPVDYLAAPIISDEQIVGAIVSFHDITEMLRLQQVRNEAMALLSHDLRAPLTSILGYAQQLHEDLEQKGLTKETRWAKILVTNGQRMNHMIEEVLARHFREGGDEPSSLFPIDLVALCQRVIAQFAHPTGTSRLHLHATSPLMVLANPIQMERVVVNLLSNSLKYSAPDSPIMIHLSEQDQYAVVAVADEGLGIEERDLPRLFEKFYRARSPSMSEGRGLGLYGSRLIVEAHGGRIWAESEPGVGSTFSFMVPFRGP